MVMPTGPARDDALSIWRAGVQAVAAERLIRQHVCWESDRMTVCGEPHSLESVRRVCVVGAGKAAGYMAAELERLSIGAGTARVLDGWVNVPADCAEPLARIHLHAARPAGVNEPRPEGAAGARQILDRVAALRPADLCLAVFTGGGSALLPAPAAGVTLEDKLHVTRYLSGAGASIRELNVVRSQLSQIKGGGLARACRAGRLLALIISDVLGDPLETIASGPTVPTSATRRQAWETLLRYYPDAACFPESVREYLAENRRSQAAPAPSAVIHNYILANNATAVTAAAEHAAERGYRVQVIPPEAAETTAEQVGRQLVERARRVSPSERPACLVWGGEPVVCLVPADRRGVGGRNQQVVLAALERLRSLPAGDDWMRRAVFLSGGTDGEDGPTDAAGALIDDQVAHAAERRELSPAIFLARNDAYTFFDEVGGLIRTGPTHTNVCDVRVVVLPS
jgi:hydroxypyruvate reductase